MRRSSAAGIAASLEAQAAEPIRIGSFPAVTGPVTFLGEPERKTLGCCAVWIDAADGVPGRPLGQVMGHHSGSAARNAGASIEPAEVREALERTRSLVDVGGILMTPQDHLMGQGFCSFELLEVQAGNWKHLH